MSSGSAAQHTCWRGCLQLLEELPLVVLVVVRYGSKRWQLQYWRHWARRPRRGANRAASASTRSSSAGLPARCVHSCVHVGPPCSRTFQGEACTAPPRSILISIQGHTDFALGISTAVIICMLFILRFFVLFATFLYLSINALHRHRQRVLARTHGCAKLVQFARLDFTFFEIEIPESYFLFLKSVHDLSSHTWGHGLLVHASL